jgi:REP element-mobilizing transposase RayT
MHVTHHRKLNRWKKYNYSQDGMYFVTICTKNRLELFGDIKNEVMILNECGEIVEKCWNEIPNHFPSVLLDEFIVMPNHVHGIIIISNNDVAVNNTNIVGNNIVWNKIIGNNIVGNKIVGNKDFCSLRHDDDLPWQTKWARSLSSIVRGFKIGVTKWCRENNYNIFQWQKSYYDHIIRNEISLQNIRRYIYYNPAKWFRDRNKPEHLYY